MQSYLILIYITTFVNKMLRGIKYNVTRDIVLNYIYGVEIMGSVDVGKLTMSGEEMLKDFVEKMGLEGAIIATAEGLEMASYLKSSLDADMLAANIASLLATIIGTLEDNDKGSLNEMIISGTNGYIAVKDLGNDVALAVITPKDYKMGSLIVALKQFVKDLQSN